MPHEHHINLELNEKVLLVLREHKIILLIKLVVWAFVAILPFIFQWVIQPYLSQTDESYTAAWILFKDVYFLFCLLGLFVILTLYHLNVHIVSNKRVIDLDQVNITKHHAVETHIARVQDVSAEIKGVLGHVFNYGTVRIQSAGEVAKIEFENIPDPKHVKRTILDSLYAHPNGGVESNKQSP